MNTCVVCGNTFKTKVKVDGKWISLYGRKRCLDCYPIGSEAPKFPFRREQKPLPKTKVCTKCGVEKDRSAFSLKRLKSGNITLQSVCKSCYSAYKKDHYRRNRDTYKQKLRSRKIDLQNKFLHYMRDKSCSCGENRVAALQFNHKDPKTKFKNVSTLVTEEYGWGTIMAEIEKCEILCANCHAVKTAQQLSWFTAQESTC